MQAESVLYPVFGSDDSGFADDLEENLAASRLHHYASRLLENSLHDELELQQALQKAIMACRAAGLPVPQNFRAIFISAAGDTHIDWLVSDLGMQLILLNADVSNPLVARLQVQILQGVH
jgi:hypothetical protein